MRILLIILILGSFGLIFPTHVEAKRPGPDPAVCRQYQGNWSREEKAAWEQLCSSGTYIAESPDNSVTGEFIHDLFTIRKYREKLNPNGIQILNAHFTSYLDLSGLNIPVGLYFEQTDFFGVVNFSEARIAGPLTLKNSGVPLLNMEGARAAGDVLVSGLFQQLKAKNVKIEGAFDIGEGEGEDIDLTNGEIGGELILDLWSGFPTKVDAPFV
ncbi:hypothetical protein [Caballeronia sp. GaOx3]|uniref:hypothetical protein n=1 Tax=Caballeronia sp. GaOx3 TaxID=2921740 RepID=UPI0020289C3E|nr:hypothetical protein [Caballeronia sp. GaOx3]